MKMCSMFSKYTQKEEVENNLDNVPDDSDQKPTGDYQTFRA